MPNKESELVTITGVNSQRIEFEPKVQPKKPAWPTSSAKREQFRVTDAALALQRGAQLEANLRGRDPTFELGTFAETPPGCPSGPCIDRNPYNFVDLPEGGPWLEQADPTVGKHHGHQFWHPQLLHGHIDLTITACSPVFAPVHTAARDEARPREGGPLSFYQLQRWVDGARKQFYAIPGSSLKGALRSMVEALANDRFGIIDDPDYYKRPIPYRRRAFNPRYQTGEFYVGRAEFKDGAWLVTPISYAEDPSGSRETYDSYLLGWPKGHRKRLRDPVPGAPTYVIPDPVVEQYHENLKHPHYRRHFDGWLAQWKKNRATREPCKPNYDGSLADGLFDAQEEIIKDAANERFRQVLERLDLKDGDIVFFTAKENQIDSFGKNVNYLWPSLWSIEDLARDWFPPKPEEKRLGLRQPLGLAERMFGFVSDHDEKKGSHPFRGKLRFEPLWGPAVETVTPEPIDLAPLTAPHSRAKSRPLYLKGRTVNDELISASYSDQEKPALRGRKFYWKQRSEVKGKIWKGHEKNNLHEASQCPEPISALPADTVFTTRIHFENLSQAELGVLLYALLGKESGGSSAPTKTFLSGSHRIHLGKGKPRGMGVCGVEAQVFWLRPAERYASLKTQNSVARAGATPNEFACVSQAFRNWCEKQARDTGHPAKFADMPHIRDFWALHTFPDSPSVRYYPVNWSQYTWLPEENRNPDEPKGGKQRRPPAMKVAQEPQKP